LPDLTERENTDGRHHATPQTHECPAPQGRPRHAGVYTLGRGRRSDDRPGRRNGHRSSVALAEEPSSEGSTADTTNTGPAGPTNTGPTNIGPAEPVTPNSDPGAPSPGPGDAPTSTVSAQTNTSEETTEEVEEEEDSTETETTDTETETETETGGEEPESSDPTVEVIPTTPPAPVQQPETTTTNNSGNASTVAPPAATAPAAKSVTAAEPPSATTPLTTSSNTNAPQLDAAITLNTAM
jgi:hypothetical protein